MSLVLNNDLMTQRGMTPSRLTLALEARGVKRDRSTVSRLMRGESKGISLDLLETLCEILNCTPNDLLLPAPTPRERTPREREEYMDALAMEFDLARYKADRHSVEFDDVRKVIPEFIERCTSKGLAYFPIR